jgi:hypothetical protein
MPMRRVVVLLAGLALLLPGTAAAYDWPVKPFDVQHPVRGSFDDPRAGMALDGQPELSFHSGIDISVPDGTPVYAIEAGWATLRPDAIVVTTLTTMHVFGYWHVKPAVHSGELVVQHQLIGTVEPDWGHVHLSESEGGIYLNPLRRGGIAPYADWTKPTIDDVLILEPRGKPANIVAITGSVDLVADAYDTPPLAPLGLWAASRVTPALIRWRIVGVRSVVVPWLTAIDFRRYLLPSAVFDDVYAPGTTENRARRPGDYHLYLAHDLDTRMFPNGVYTLEVFAEDTRGNTAQRSLPFRVVNQSA